MSWQTLVSAERIAGQLGDPRLRIFDCRHELARPAAGREAYLRGHLPGAQFADLDRDLATPPTATSGRHPLPPADVFAQRLRAWGVDDDSRLLAYDDASGMWAARFWWMAHRWLGHAHVAVLEAGYTRWQALGLPTTSELPPPRAQGNFQARLDASAVVDIDTVQAAAQDPRRRVFDARAPERYRGEVEPIDAVAGHIPGAVNLPSASQLTADATFVARDALAASFRRALGDVGPGDAIAMCGSGVTACHVLLGMEHAGLPGAKLYAGSWSEWSRDASRPVAKGSAP